MSALENQAVFLIQSYQGPENKNLKKLWSKNVRNSILKILFYLDEINQPSGSLNADYFKTKHGVNWSYRFIKEKCSRVCFNKQEFKPFNHEQFQVFEEEVRYFCSEDTAENKDNKNTNGLVNGGAHILAEELMSMVHDYTWENSHVLSPVRIAKKSKQMKRFSSSRRLQKMDSASSLGKNNFSLLDCDKERKGQNYIFVVSPIPISQQDIDDYFEWHVPNIKHIQQKLMPPQLSDHFCDRHNIKLLWLETRYQPSDGFIQCSDTVGAELIKSFLNSIDGNIIPHHAMSDMTKSENKCSNFLLSFVSTSSILNHYFHRDAKCKLVTETLPICIQKSSTVSDILCTFKISNQETKQKTDFEQKCLDDHECANCKEQSLKNSTGKKTLNYININGFISTMQLQNIILSNDDDLQLSYSWFEITSENASNDCVLLLPRLKEGNFGCILQIINQCKNCFAQCEKRVIDENYCYIFVPVMKNIGLVLTFRIPKDVPMPIIMNDDFFNHFQEILSNNHAQESASCNRELVSFSRKSTEKWFSCITSSLAHMKHCGNSIKSSKYMKEEKELLKMLTKSYQVLRGENSGKKNKRDSTESVNSNSNFATKIGGEFTSDEKMLETLKNDYTNLLSTEPEGNFVTQCAAACASLLSTSQNIVNVVLHRCKHATPNGVDWKTKVSSLIQKNFILSTKDLRKKKETEHISVVTNECVLQILFHLELVSLKPDAPHNSEDISSILRLFSLCTSPVAMTNFLNTVLLDNYATTSGELLHDVYNDLLQPLPQQLKMYSQETEESFSILPSVKSIASATASVTSSNPASCRSGPGSSGIRKRSIRMPSFNGPAISRQIAIPAKTNSVASRRSFESKDNAEDDIKTRLRNSAKKIKKIIAKNVSKDTAKVCRDLFSNTESVTSNKSNFDDDPSLMGKKKLLVSDTPDAKQKYTALKRQKLREIQEERRRSGGAKSLTMIAESPAKDEIRRSPRHTVMLKRRSSFYNTGKESRSVQRAQIIQYHNEGVVATPKAVKGRLSLASGLLFSNKKEDFVDEDPFDCGEEIPMAHVPEYVMESPAKNTRSQVSRHLFKTPKKCDITSPLKPSSAKKDQIKNNVRLPSGSMINGQIGSQTHGLGVVPLLPSPMKTPKKVATTPQKVICNSFVTPKKSLPCSAAKKPIKVTPQILKMPINIKTPKFNLPEITEEKKVRPESAVNITNKFEQKTPVKNCDTLDIQPLDTSPDDKVTIDGIPSPCRIRRNVRLPKKRKWSLATDNTPTRDDINQWPRKKKSSDKSSPGVVGKRSKNNSPDNSYHFSSLKDTPSPDNGVFILQDTDDFGIGRIILPSTENFRENKRLRKYASPPLSSGPNSTSKFKRHSSISLNTNNNHTSSTDFSNEVFPLTNCNDSLHDTVFFEDNNITDSSNNNDKHFFPNKRTIQSENINPFKHKQVDSIHHQVGELSARSLYHLHTSPIISTSERHQHRTTRSQK